MPGITGLETLAKIKEVSQQIPIVLITKNETENLMNDAIGSQISDYLIKPVNPNQVLLSLKKILDNKRLVAEKTTTAYQQQFRNLFMALNSSPDYNEWMDIYKNLCTGNWKWKRVIVLRCRKCCRARRVKRILNFSNLFHAIMHHG
jgi:DNA-binding NtrC family response regulator